MDNFSEIDQRWLIENGLYDIADPSNLYDEIVKRRERGDDGIIAPVSKLVGCFSLVPTRYHHLRCIQRDG